MNGFTLKIESLDNAAFGDGDARCEVARILAEVSNKIQDGVNTGICRDINGNKVGEWELNLPLE